MFPSFLRARADSYFKARSAGRDTETDHARAASVLSSVENALDEAKAEQAGLKSRIDEVLARAAVTQGNDADEYLTRDPEDNHCQSLLNAEIANGQRRLNELEATTAPVITKTSRFIEASELGKAKMRPTTACRRSARRKVGTSWCVRGSEC